MKIPFCARVSVAAAVALVLAGCAGMAPSPRGDVGEAAPPPPPRTTTRPGPVGGPAVVALLSRADSERRQGDLAHSDATLERALRIEPNNPWIWSRLAELRLAQGNAQQAEAFASKSNSLADASPSLRAKNWDTIAQARRMSGDSDGAQQARQQAAALREQGI